MPTTETDFAARTERHRRELHVHCYRMLGSFDEAEDLVQETLLRAWRRREDLEDEERLRAWLYSIATNACLDAIKAKGRRVPSLSSFKDVPWLEPYPDELLEQVAPAGEEPAAAAVSRETIELTFLAVMQLLPPRQRAALVLRDVLDWPAAEVAETLDIGVAAVNSAHQRARATIREHLPTTRREDWTAPAVSATERRLLDRFIETHENGDREAALALLAEDIRVTMPPEPLCFEGRAALAGLMDRAHTMPGRWHLLPTRANRLPAAASYFHPDGEPAMHAFKLDVLRIEGDAIAEVTTFHGRHLAAFGLPETLTPAGFEALRAAGRS